MDAGADGVDGLGGQGGDPAEALQEIERDTLAGQDGATCPDDVADDCPGNNWGAVGGALCHDDLRVYRAVDGFDQRQPCDHAGLFGRDTGIDNLIGRNGRPAGDVAALASASDSSDEVL